MKRKNLFRGLFIGLFTLTTLVSCSSDDTKNEAIVVNPGTDNPGTDNPGTDNPGTDNPGTDNPGTDTPPGTTKVYKHKVLIEDFTGAWCKFCPRVSHAIEQAEQSYGDDIVVAAIHNSQDPNPASGSHDPFHLAAQSPLISKLKITGFPAVYVNRASKWKYPEDTYIENPKTYLQDGSPIGIKIGSTLTASTGTINVSFKFSFDYTKQLKYVVYVLEDGLIFRQANATNHYGNTTGQTRWENNFIHNSVVRTVSGNILGTDIPTEKSKKNETFSVENISVNYTSADVNKLRVAVIVLDNDGKALNAQFAKANTTLDYQEHK